MRLPLGVTARDWVTVRVIRVPEVHRPRGGWLWVTAWDRGSHWERGRVAVGATSLCACPQLWLRVAARGPGTRCAAAARENSDLYVARWQCRCARDCVWLCTDEGDLCGTAV